MSTPDFVLVVLAAIAGIAAAGGGIVLTFKTPKYAAARAAFVIAALSVFFAGVTWGVTAEHSSMLARYIGAGATAAAAAIGLVWILTHLEGEKEPAEVTAFLECNFGIMPKTFPSSGRLWWTEVGRQIFEPFVLPLGNYFGPPNSEFGTGIKLDIAYECRLNNYSAEPLFNVTLFPTATFREVIQNKDNPNVQTGGNVIATKQGTLSIPKVEPNNSFVFYLKSQNENFVEVAFAPEFKFERSGREHAARLLFAKGMHISLNPFEGFKSPPAPPPPAPSPPSTQEKK